MDVKQIRYFLAVAEELHFGHAADRLNVAQSPLSRVIRGLEKELGVELFDRTTRSVTLTDAGEALITPANMVMKHIEACKEAARAAAGGESGVVSLGFGGATGYKMLSGVVQAVDQSFPGIKLDLQPRTYAGRALDKIQSGELDIGVVSGPVPSSVEAVKISDESLVVAVPCGDPLAERETITAADLNGKNMVAYPTGLGSSVRHEGLSFLARAGSHAGKIYDAPDPYSLLAMVGANVGLSLVLESTQQVRMDGVVYRKLAGDVAPTMPIGVAWSRSNQSPAVWRVVEILRDLWT